jgi:hypothetical protein
MANLPYECNLSHIDFIENYTFQIWNEISQCISTHFMSQYLWTSHAKWTLQMDLMMKVKGSSKILISLSVMVKNMIFYLFNIVYYNIGIALQIKV